MHTKGDSTVTTSNVCVLVHLHLSRDLYSLASWWKYYSPAVCTGTTHTPLTYPYMDIPSFDAHITVVTVHVCVHCMHTTVLIYMVRVNKQILSDHCQIGGCLHLHHDRDLCCCIEWSELELQSQQAENVGLQQIIHGTICIKVCWLNQCKLTWRVSVSGYRCSEGSRPSHCTRLPWHMRCNDPPKLHFTFTRSVHIHIIRLFMHSPSRVSRGCQCTLGRH